MEKIEELISKLGRSSMMAKLPVAEELIGELVRYIRTLERRISELEGGENDG